MNPGESMKHKLAQALRRLANHIDSPEPTEIRLTGGTYYISGPMTVPPGVRITSPPRNIFPSCPENR